MARGGLGEGPYAGLAGEGPLHAERTASKKTGEWMYMFKPRIGEVIVYVKVIVRTNCVVISFHEDQIDENN